MLIIRIVFASPPWDELGYTFFEMSRHLKKNLKRTLPREKGKTKNINISQKKKCIPFLLDEQRTGPTFQEEEEEEEEALELIIGPLFQKKYHFC